MLKTLFGGLDGWYLAVFMRFVEGPLSMAVGAWAFVDPQGFLATLLPTVPLPASAHPAALIAASMAGNLMIMVGALKLTLLSPRIDREARWLFVRLEILVKSVHALISIRIILLIGLAGGSWLNHGLAFGQLAALCASVAFEQRLRTRTRQPALAR